MSADRPGQARIFALKVFRKLPARPSHAIVHVLTPTFSIGAVALVEHDGNVLALKQTHRRGWSFPGGLVDRGEQPHEAVVREMREETGIDISSGDIVATVFDTEARHIDVIFRVVCDRRPEVTVASEAVAFIWVPLDKWPGGADKSTSRILAAVEASAQPRVTGQLR